MVRLGVLPLTAVLSAGPVPAQGNSVLAQVHSERMTVAVSPAGSAADEVQGAVVREIDDPECGTRWLLLRDGSDPGGPGRLVPVQSLRGETGAKTADGTATEIAAAPPKTVIRAGDRLVIEQETTRVSARLEAVALGPAAAGKLVRARLEVGGKIVEARALAPGRATLEPEELP